MALDHNAVVTELWRRINEALTIPLQTAATAASDALLAQIAAEAARDEALGVKQYVDTELEKKANKTHTHKSADITDAQSNASLNESAAGKLVAWDSGRRIQTQDPVRDANPATKRYVDQEVGKKADTSHTHGVADINATGTRGATTYLRGDGTWVVPPNTTYSVPSQAEAEAGTATTARTWSAQRVHQAISAKAAPLEHRHTSEQIDGLDDTLNTAMTTKADITYVDDKVAKKADEDHIHTSADITDTSPTGNSGAGKIARWNTAGKIETSANPTSNNDLTRKGYVDSRIQWVTSWPSNPVSGVLYLMEED